MPFRVAVTVELAQPVDLHPEQLEGVAVALLGGHGGEGGVRRWTVRPVDRLDPVTRRIEVRGVEDGVDLDAIAPAGDKLPFAFTTGRIVRTDVRSGPTLPDIWAQAEPRAELSFAFRSPTTHTGQGGAPNPVPYPPAVFGGWLRWWSTAGGPLPAALAGPATLTATQTRAWVVDQAVTLVDYELATIEVVAKQRDGGRPIPGYVGWATFRAPRPTEDAGRLLDALGRFAEFCGTGRHTSIGMGATDYLRE